MSDDQRFDRRQEDQEMARWRGGIDARMNAVENDMHDLVKQCGIIDRTVTRMEGRLDLIQREQADMHGEIRTAATQIDHGRDEAVEELKRTISTSEAARSAWQFTKFQVGVGAVVALLAPTFSTLLVLLVTGQFH